jgi:hypothetical protein
VSAFGWVLALIAFSWFGLFVTLGWADAMLRARDRQQLELREWREKVEAMRRIYDMEEDA